MSCTEKRHLSHRGGGGAGSMVHHRFPNGFTEIFMDETDREVKSLTDRAFRSLCVGDEAVYNDEFCYGYSPFSCHKPLAEEPTKKTHKEGSSKKQINGAGPQPWPKKGMSSTVSSLLKAFSVREEGMLTKNGDSWDKSALLSIQQELSEFSSDYHNSLSDRHFDHTKNSRDGTAKKSDKDGSQLSGKSSKSKNGKSSNKLRKLNIKNLFLHSEFSPFQSWRDLNKFPFGQEGIITSILPLDNLPKWYDSPLYKELTEAHRIETLHTKVTELCQKPASVEPIHAPTPPPPAPPPPPPPRVPPKVMPKPSSAVPAEKRCSSEGESVAPWRRNRSRAKSAIPGNQPGILSPPHDGSKDVSQLLGKKEVKSVAVKAVEDPSPLASMPFSISQLMTPVIPSRQPTETSEILQTVFSPSALDLPLRPDSEAKVTPEPPAKRGTYKSIASNLLFNLKDNRKRVKSRYSPPKFKTTEITDRSRQSPILDLTLLTYSHAGSDGTASGFSTPAILKDGQTICTPVSESANAQTVRLKKYLEPDRPISDDYLISNLLQTKKDATGSRNLNDAQENGLYVGSPYTNSKMNKSPLVNKQSYPSLNLYKKASHEAEMKSLNKNTLSVANKDPPTTQTNGLSPNVLDNTTRPVKDFMEIKEKDIKDNRDKTTMDIIRAAKEAISAAKNKALSSTLSDSTKKRGKDVVELRGKEMYDQAVNTKGFVRSNQGMTSTEQNDRTEILEVLPVTKTRREPPPVPKRTNNKPPGKCHTQDRLTNGDTGGDISIPKEKEAVKKQDRLKHIFSSRQNNYIKSQRYVMVEGDEEEDYELKGENIDLNKYPEVMAPREVKDSEHVISDLHALKELERARLADRLLKDNENMNNIISGNNIDEDTKVKNDMISRELRNIKRGMLSMRGNMAAKREAVTKKDQEQKKHELFAKIDCNVVVNKSRINNNYDKAKMALEEIISERAERLKNKGSNHEEWERNWVSEEQSLDDSYAARVQERKQARYDALWSTVEDKQNGVDLSVLREKEMRDRLEDLRDHNHMQQILSQTEVKHGDNPGDRVNFPGMDRAKTEPNKVSTIRSKSNTEEQSKLMDEKEGGLNEKEHVRMMSEEGDSNTCLTNLSRQTSVETKENKTIERRESKLEVPPVPPRIKKGTGKKEGSSERETESRQEDILQDRMKESEELQSINERRQTRDQDCEVAVPIEKDTAQNKMCLIENINSSMQESNAKTDAQSVTKQSKVEHHITKPLELPKIKRKAPLPPDQAPSNTVELSNEQSVTTKDKTPANTQRAAPNQTIEEPDKLSIISMEIVAITDAAVHEDIAAIKDAADYDNIAAVTDVAVHDIVLHGEAVSPLLLNGSDFNQSPPDHSSMSSKSSYFSVESTLLRNTDSTIFHSLENLIGEVDEEVNNVISKVDEEVENVDKDVENVSENVGEDLEKSTVEYYSMSKHESEPEVKDRTEISPTQCGEGEMPSQEDSKPREGRKINKRPLWSHVVKKNDNQTPKLQARFDSNVCSSTNNQTVNVQSLPSSNVASPTNHQAPNIQSPSCSTVCSPTSKQTPNVQSQSSSNACSPPINQTPNVQSKSESNVCSPPNSQTSNVQSPSESNVCSPLNNQTPKVQSPSGSKVCSPTINQTSNVQSPSGSSIASPTNHQTESVQSLSSSNVSSPSIEKPSLFKVKDNTFSNKKPVSHHPSLDPVAKLLSLGLNSSERGGSDTLKHLKESVEIGLPSNTTTTPEKLSKKPQETEQIEHIMHSHLAPSNLETDDFKAGQCGVFLTVPQEDDRQSGVSRSSEGLESPADTEDTGSKAPSERSGSGCSANDPHGPNRPPVVAPKSEKALLRAMKLTTRRIRKEEAESKPTHKSSHSSSRNSSKREHKSEKTEETSNSCGGEKHRSGDKNHRERTEHHSHSGDKHHSDRAEHSSHNRERDHHGRAEQSRQNREVAEKVNHGSSSSSERRGRSSEKLRHEKPEQRYHSTERVISDVPVYKAHSGDRPVKQQLRRSQSNDRYIVDKAEYRRKGYEKPVSDRTDLRSQQIESTVEGHQRGRARDKLARDKPFQRSHSIDPHHEAADLPSHHPTNLSRQSSYTSQLSRQSSIEHAIITQSFPMTQRKLLQDPDSGQYFVVDMPIQVQTKTFFDPETGNYVQLPVQPPEGSIHQASTMEVLNTPLVLYHGFVPVPVSSIPAKKSMVQSSQQEQEEFRQHLMRVRQEQQNEEGQPYLEPVYGAQDHMLGEFLGTEELDCMS